MEKFKFIFLSLISLFFLSCESVYLDMNNVHCKLDKETYAKEEKITLTYYGNFKDNNDIGNLRIDFTVYKLINGERDHENFPDINLSDNPESISNFSDGLYYKYIKENEIMTDFNDILVFRIKESGEYELVVDIRGSTDRHPYGGSQYFTFPITITD